MSPPDKSSDVNRSGHIGSSGSSSSATCSKIARVPSPSIGASSAHAPAGGNQ